MANLNDPYIHNVESDFFVDNSCINCGTCYWMAPNVFENINNQSAVSNHPTKKGDIHLAHAARYSCPTNSIGFKGNENIGHSFPRCLDENVYHLGFHDRKSFGATSYFIKTGSKNIMIDSPRFATSLVNNIQRLGGVQLQLFTHQDDIADGDKYNKKFNSTVYYPKDEKQHERLKVDTFLESDNKDIQITPELLAIPVPGHTKGHFCFLYKEKFLFTGDHLCYSSKLGHLFAFLNHCWYSKVDLFESVIKLKNYTFSAILPGHGAPRLFNSTSEATESLDEGIEWIKRHI